MARRAPRLSAAARAFPAFMGLGGRGYGLVDAVRRLIYLPSERLVVISWHTVSF